MLVSGALYTLALIASVKGRVSILVPALCLAVSVCIHLASVALLPSLLAAALIGRIEPRRLALTVVAPALAGVILTLLDYPFPSGGGSLFEKHLLPLSEPLPHTAAYFLQTPIHFVDVLNALLLSATAFLCGLTLFRKPFGPEDFVLLGLVLPPVVLIATINPEIGAFRDWDILAFPSVFLTIWLVHRVVRMDSSVRHRVMAVLIGVSVLHTAPWVSVNAEAHASVGRFKALLANAANSERGTQYGWDSLGGYLRDAGREEEAYETYKTGVSMFPDHPRMRRAAAHAAGKLGKFDEAVEHFEFVIGNGSDQDTLIANYGRALLKVGRNREASEQFSVVLSRNIAAPNIAQLQALAEFRMGNYAKAVQITSEAVKRSPPGLYEDHLLMGSAYWLLKDPLQAIVAFEQALRISPGQVDAIKRLAATHTSLGEHASALRALRGIPDRERGVDIQKQIASAHYGMGAYDSSAAYYRKLLASLPNDGDLHYRLGSAYLAAGNPEQALGFFQSAVRLSPSHPGFYRNLGVAFSGLERFDEAKAAFRSLLKLQPDVADRDELEEWINDH